MEGISSRRLRSGHTGELRMRTLKSATREGFHFWRSEGCPKPTSTPASHLRRAQARAPPRRRRATHQPDRSGETRSQLIRSRRLDDPDQPISRVRNALLPTSTRGNRPKPVARSIFHTSEASSANAPPDPRAGWKPPRARSDRLPRVEITIWGRLSAESARGILICASVCGVRLPQLLAVEAPYVESVLERPFFNSPCERPSMSG